MKVYKYFRGGYHYPSKRNRPIFLFYLFRIIIENMGERKIETKSLLKNIIFSNILLYEVLNYLKPLIAIVRPFPVRISTKYTITMFVLSES